MRVLKTFLVGTHILRMFNTTIFEVLKSYIDSRVNLIPSYITNYMGV
jgi:hypothetical protein